MQQWSKDRRGGLLPYLSKSAECSGEVNEEVLHALENYVPLIDSLYTYTLVNSKV